MTPNIDDNAPPRVCGLSHAAYRCRSVEETTRFYEGLLGFPLSQALEMHGHPTTGEDIHYMHVFFDIGSADERHSSYIAFFEVKNLAGDDFVFKRQWGMDLHFAMTVRDHADLEAWRQRLIAKGIAVEGPIDHDELFTSIYFHDPNGYRLEFTTQDEKAKAQFRANVQTAHASLESWIRRDGQPA